MCLKIKNMFMLLSVSRVCRGNAQLLSCNCFYASQSNFSDVALATNLTDTTNPVQSETIKLKLFFLASVLVLQEMIASGLQSINLSSTFLSIYTKRLWQ